jgi:hypothetical protein
MSFVPAWAWAWCWAWDALSRWQLSEAKETSNSNDEMQGSFAALRMTAKYGDDCRCSLGAVKYQRRLEVLIEMVREELADDERRDPSLRSG